MLCGLVAGCRWWGYSLVAELGFLTAVASLVAELGLWGMRPAVVVAVVVIPGFHRKQTVFVVHGLSCCESCGIFPVQGSNLCLLPWQMDSLPLSYQGNTHLHLFLCFSLLFSYFLFLFFILQKKEEKGAICLWLLFIFKSILNPNFSLSSLILHSIS